MALETGYKKTARRIIRDLLKKEFGNRFKQYFVGDPIAIPASYLPAIAIDKTVSNFDNGPTQMDEREQQIQIRVIFNKMDEFNKNDEEVVLDEKVENVIEGIDPATGSYKEDSVIGVLRRNITLENFAINQIIGINYEPLPRPGELVTSEGVLTITITDLVPVLNRV